MRLNYPSLVEDYEPNILVATVMLRISEYRYEVAHNGQEAVDKFSSGKYTLILLDVQMPFMDGYETTRHIRGFERFKRLIACAYYSDDCPRPQRRPREVYSCGNE